MQKSMSLKIFGIFSTLFVLFFTCTTLDRTPKNNIYYAFKPCSHKQLTYNNFMEIKIGSKYTDVVKILGEESYKNSKIIDGYKDTIYLWKIANTDKKIFVTFRNGIVITKEQYKLVDTTNNYPNDILKKLNYDMSYDDVKSLLGEGILISESTNTKAYKWNYESSNSINCTFNNNHLTYFIKD